MAMQTLLQTQKKGERYNLLSHKERKMRKKGRPMQSLPMEEALKKRSARWKREGKECRGTMGAGPGDEGNRRAAG